LFSRKKTGAALLTVVFCVTLLLISLRPTETQFVLVLQNEEFAPAVATYTNKTMPFEIGDIYGDYAYWTCSGGGLQGFDAINAYITDCDAGEFEFFGFDEFVNHNVIHIETLWEGIVAPTSTFDLVPLGYFYQKTDLDSATHWALAIVWDENGVISLLYNSGNGNTPSNTTLTTEVFDSGDEYFISLDHLGQETSIYIYQTTYPEGLIYSGSVNTGEEYDASVLYAGFGNIAYYYVNVWSRSYYLMISDVTFTYPSGGIGFNRIDAYVDEVFTQTMFDMDGGANPVLAINATVTNITLLVSTWLNATTYGISTLAEGKNIIRHNVTVIGTNGTVVFSQSNLTYISGADYGENVFLYEYSVELIFTPVSGQVYTVTITYEIFYALEVGG